MIPQISKAPLTPQWQQARVSNNFKAVNVLGIYLGPDTSHCIVAGNSNTTIQNFGTDNVIVNTGAAP